MMKRQGEDNSQSDKDCQPCGKAAATGRTGMDLWQILVLGVTALAPGSSAYRGLVIGPSIITPAFIVNGFSAGHGITGGFTTNIVISRHTFYYTNGVLMNIQ